MTKIDRNIIDLFQKNRGKIHRELSKELQILSTDYNFLIIHNGNAGDALIVSACAQILEKLNIKFRTLHEKKVIKKAKNTTFFLAGGNLTSEWNCEEWLLPLLSNCQKLCIFPSTFGKMENFFSALRPQDVIFCRDYESYNLLTECAVKCKLYISPDVAFSFETKKYMLLKNTNLKLIVKILIFQTFHFMRRLKHTYLYAFRNDLEKNQLLNLERKYLNDISLLGHTSSSNLNNINNVTSNFLYLCSKYDSVHTDRLHVLIGALLVGTPLINFSDTKDKKISRVLRTFCQILSEEL